MNSKLRIWTMFALLGFLCALQAATTSLRIREIRLEGNHYFSDRHLKGLLKTRKGDRFDIRFLRLDQIRLTNYYQHQGFLDVFIDSDFQREGDFIRVVFSIREGKRYFLKHIQFRGNQIIDSTGLRRMIPIKDGEPYRVPLIEEGLNRIEEFYLDHGKPYVKIDQETRGVQDSLLILTVFIEENQTVVIDEVKFQGLRLTRESIVRRELAIRPGEIFSRSKIEKTQSNLYATGLFQLVSTNVVPRNGDRSRVVLVINLQEKRPAWIGFRFGISYERATDFGGTSGSTFDVTFEGGHRNLFGTGRSLQFRAVPSFQLDFASKSLENPRNQLQMTYVQPRIGLLRSPLLVQLFYERVNFTRTVARYTAFTGLMKLNYQFDTEWELTETVSFQNVRTDSLALLPQGQDKVYSLTSTLSRDRRDNFLNPQHGYYMEFQAKLAISRSLNTTTGAVGQNRFVRFVAQWNRYQPFQFQRNWTLASRVRGGIIFNLGGGGPVPVLERFYLGGASSVRGYPERSLGPREPGDPQLSSGGKLMLLGNVELRIPLFWLFYGTVFTDVGNVWGQVDEFRPPDLKVASGLGIALMTPLGPFRLDYGQKWFPQPGEPPGEFHVGISFAF